MHFEVNGPYSAEKLFELHKDIKKGQPSFANLRADPKEAWKGSPAVLRGPGIYGVFCKGNLAYVGVYTGNKRKTFVGSAIDRWFMHLTYFSLRSPKISFAPKNMARILAELSDGAPSKAFATLLEKANWKAGDLKGVQVPFLTGGNSCTYNKANFATRNWDVFAPGKETEMMTNISFVYARFLPETVSLLGNLAGTPEGYRWVKKKWLTPREGHLIKTLRPICNSQTKKDPRHNVCVDEFITALRAEMEKPLAAV